MVDQVFNFKTIVVKIFSCAAAVGAGLPAGPEGPMIHLGAMIGAGVSQMRSKTLGFETSWFSRFRNAKDRRDFISAGAGAGVSSAFGAPVGGLLFTMEEVSSFWDQKLGWQVRRMVSTFSTQLFNSAFCCLADFLLLYGINIHNPAFQFCLQQRRWIRMGWYFRPVPPYDNHFV